MAPRMCAAAAAAFGSITDDTMAASAARPRHTDSPRRRSTSSREATADATVDCRKASDNVATDQAGRTHASRRARQWKRARAVAALRPTRTC
eukprot:scaffold26380_cov96-Isochrysis_galbana.AAC.2